MKTLKLTPSTPAGTQPGEYGDWADMGLGHIWVADGIDATSTYGMAGLCYSNDFGATWTKKEDYVGSDNQGARCAKDGTNVFYAYIDGSFVLHVFLYEGRTGTKTTTYTAYNAATFEYVQDLFYMNSVLYCVIANATVLRILKYTAGAWAVVENYTTKDGRNWARGWQYANVYYYLRAAVTTGYIQLCSFNGAATTVVCFWTVEALFIFRYPVLPRRPEYVEVLYCCINVAGVYYWTLLDASRSSGGTNEGPVYLATTQIIVPTYWQMKDYPEYGYYMELESSGSKRFGLYQWKIGVLLPIYSMAVTVTDILHFHYQLVDRCYLEPTMLGTPILYTMAVTTLVTWDETFSQKEISWYQAPKATYFANQIVMMYDDSSVLLARVRYESSMTVNGLQQFKGMNLNSQDYAIPFTFTFVNSPSGLIIQVLLDYPQSIGCDNTALIQQGTGSYNLSFKAGDDLKTQILWAEMEMDGIFWITPWGYCRLDNTTGGFTSTGITASIANANFIPSNPTNQPSTWGVVYIFGGYVGGIQLWSIKRNQNADQNQVFRGMFPYVTVQADLDILAQAILTNQLQGMARLPILLLQNGLVQYGQTVDIDLTNFTNSYPGMNSIVMTMFVNRSSYSFETNGSQIELTSHIVHPDPVISLSTLQAGLANLATDVQTSGNLYHPKIKLSREDDVNLTSAAAYEIAWNISTTKSRITHSTSSDPHLITIDEAGWYEIHIQVQFGANAAGTRLVRMYVDGTSAGCMRLRDDAASVEQSMIGSCGLQLTAGQVLKFDVYAIFTSTLALTEAHCSLCRTSL